MTQFRETSRRDYKWATFNFDADAVDDPEPYRSLIKERQRIAARLQVISQQLLTGGRKRRRQTNHAKKHKVIIKEYFGVLAVIDENGVVLQRRIPPTHNLLDFHRRFRMSPPLFQKIYEDIQDPVLGCSAFLGNTDAVGRAGASAMQKIVAVMRQLAYGTANDAQTEYSGVKRDCARKALYSYCKFIIRAYGPEYLGSWGEEELKTEMEANAKRGFPGMMGSIDCTHWLWKNCPIAWQGMYQDRNHNRSIVAEAICGHDMYFFQAYVGLPGSLNDINIMNQTTMQRNYMRSSAIDHKFKIGEQEYTGAYFLADGIYPDYPYLVKSIPEPLTNKEKNFAKVQEACRKDVERAFGRLLSKWHILATPGRCKKLKHLKYIWLACIILHNMTLRDQQSADLEKEEDAVDAAAAAEVEVVGVVGASVHPGCQPLRDPEFLGRDFNGVLDKLRQMENKGMCHLMQRQLVEHVWAHSGKDVV